MTETPDKPIPEDPEELLTLIFGFTVSGIYLHKKGSPRRLATSEEKAMWAALLYQAQNAQDKET